MSVICFGHLVFFLFLFVRCFRGTSCWTPRKKKKTRNAIDEIQCEAYTVFVYPRNQTQLRCDLIKCDFVVEFWNGVVPRMVERHAFFFLLFSVDSLKFIDMSHQNKSSNCLTLSDIEIRNEPNRNTHNSCIHSAFNYLLNWLFGGVVFLCIRFECVPYFLWFPFLFTVLIIIGCVCGMYVFRLCLELRLTSKNERKKIQNNPILCACVEIPIDVHHVSLVVFFLKCILEIIYGHLNNWNYCFKVFPVEWHICNWQQQQQHQQLEMPSPQHHIQMKRISVRQCT